MRRRRGPTLGTPRVILGDSPPPPDRPASVPEKGSVYLAGRKAWKTIGHKYFDENGRPIKPRRELFKPRPRPGEREPNEKVSSASPFPEINDEQYDKLQQSGRRKISTLRDRNPAPDYLDTEVARFHAEGRLTLFAIAESYSAGNTRRFDIASDLLAALASGPLPGEVLFLHPVNGRLLEVSESGLRGLPGDRLSRLRHCWVAGADAVRWREWIDQRMLPEDAQAEQKIADLIESLMERRAKQQARVVKVIWSKWRGQPPPMSVKIRNEQINNELAKELVDHPERKQGGEVSPEAIDEALKAMKKVFGT